MSKPVHGFTLIRTRPCLNLVSVEGFTLIELLIVISVLGVLAAAVWTSLDPAERIKQFEDGQRKSAVSSLANAVISYATNREGKYPWYPVQSNTWISDLVAWGELKTVPSNPNPIIDGACAGMPPGGSFGQQNSYCLVTTSGGQEAIVYVQMISRSEKKKCPADYTGRVWFLYSSVDAKAGIVCFDEVLPGENYEYR